MIMNFLYPYVLWGLLAVAIPVIIHLFNFRRFRKVYFTNVRFLEELQQQTRRQSQLRHLLVMILRMLGIAALVVAFAQPFIPEPESSLMPASLQRVCIHVDNSFSMEAVSEQGSLLEQARAEASGIVAAYRTTDIFMITTNSFDARQQRWITREEALQEIESISVSPYSRKLSEIYLRQNDRLTRTKDQPGTSYVISDFQESMADFENVTADSLVTYRLVPVAGSGQGNLFIDSCWFSAPVHQIGQGVRLVARVVNESGTDYEKMPVRLMINGNQKALAAFDIRAGNSVDVELPFTNNEPGLQYGTLEITDFPVTFDDRFYLAYEVAGSIPVLSVNEGGENIYLNSLFGRDSAFLFVNNPHTNIDYGRLQGFGLIIFNGLREISTGLAQELTTFLGNSGTIMIVPSPEMNIESFRSFLQSAGANYFTAWQNEQTRITQLDLENPLFSEVFERTASGRSQDLEDTDLPQIRSFFGMTRTAGGFQIPLMTMLNGQPFLTYEKAGNGEIYLLSVPLDDASSNFPRHAVFVPAMYRIALLSAATAPLSYTIGRDELLELNNTSITGDQVVKISTLDGTYEFIPGQENRNKRMNIRIMGQISTAGHYRVTDGGNAIKGMGFNYDRSESKMVFADESRLKELSGRYAPGRFSVLAGSGKAITETIKDMNRGTSLWKLFIILALAFLAVEILFLRYWKLKR
jgi:hypothetical protein